MKALRQLIISLSCLLIPVLVACGDTITNGMSKQQVIAILGTPRGTIGDSNHLTLLFETGYVDLIDDEVSYFRLTSKSHIREQRKRDAVELAAYEVESEIMLKEQARQTAIRDEYHRRQQEERRATDLAQQQRRQEQLRLAQAQAEQQRKEREAARAAQRAALRRPHVSSFASQHSPRRVPAPSAPARSNIDNDWLLSDSSYTPSSSDSLRRKPSSSGPPSVALSPVGVSDSYDRNIWGGPPRHNRPPSLDSQSGPLSGWSDQISGSTYHTYRGSSGNSLRGWSDRIGNSTYHSMRDSRGNETRGSSDSIGNSTHHSLRSSDGTTMRGWSDSIGNSTYHSYRDSDGNTVRGWSDTIGGSTYHSLRDSRGNRITGWSD